MLRAGIAEGNVMVRKIRKIRLAPGLDAEGMFTISIRAI